MKATLGQSGIWNHKIEVETDESKKYLEGNLALEKCEVTMHRENLYFKVHGIFPVYFHHVIIDFNIERRGSVSTPSNVKEKNQKTRAVSGRVASSAAKVRNKREDWALEIFDQYFGDKKKDRNFIGTLII